MYQVIRKSEYLPHPELKDLNWKVGSMFLFYLHIPFFLYTVLTRSFPNFVATMDATVLLTAVFYSLVVRPLVMRGMIPAFYRNRYVGSKLGLWISFVYYGAIIRAGMLVLYYGVTYLILRDTKQFEPYLRDFKDNYHSKEGIIAALVLSIYTLFLLYYKVRFIKIKTFSNKAIQLVKNHGWNVHDAMYKVIHDRELELEKKAILNVKYDQESPIFDTNMVSQDMENMQEGKANFNQKDKGCIVEQVIQEEPMPLRRQARV